MLVAASLAVIAVAGRPARPAAQPLESPCSIQTRERVIAVGDVHGAYDAFVAILRSAGLIDRRDRWSGGRAILVQTGDVLDRGAHSRPAVDLLRRLEREASAAGGRVYALLGNHEFMRLVGDWRYVSAGELQAFTTADSPDLRQRAYEAADAREKARANAEQREHDSRAYREQFMKDVPLGWLEMRAAFAANGEYGKWMRSRPAMITVNGIAFLHGGVSAAAAPLGCAGINETVRREMASLPVPPDALASLLATSETGPLWYRGLAREPEDTFAATLTDVLAKLAARAVVVGHTTVPGRIATRFGGRVIQIDSGMLNGEFYPGGVPAALEIAGGRLTAIYADRRERLSTPALDGSAP